MYGSIFDVANFFCDIYKEGFFQTTLTGILCLSRAIRSISFYWPVLSEKFKFRWICMVNFAWFDKKIPCSGVQFLYKAQFFLFSNYFSGDFVFIHAVVVESHERDQSSNTTDLNSYLLPYSSRWISDRNRNPNKLAPFFLKVLLFLNGL